MEDSEKDNDGGFIDPWFNFSPWERECLQHKEAEPDVEARLLLEKQAILDSLWASFQNAAKSVAQLYKGKVFKSVKLKSERKAMNVNLRYFYSSQH